MNNKSKKKITPKPEQSKKTSNPKNQAVKSDNNKPDQTKKVFPEKTSDEKTVTDSIQSQKESNFSNQSSETDQSKHEESPEPIRGITPENRKSSIIKIVWPFLIVILAVGIYYVFFYDKPLEKIGGTNPTKPGFNRVSFTNYAISKYPDYKYQCAVLNLSERVKMQSEDIYIFKFINRGHIFIDLDVQVEYQYYVDMPPTGDWNIEVSNNICIVRAPTLKADKPCLDTESISMRTEDGWGRFDEEEYKEEAIKSLTAILEKRANSDKNINYIKDEARISIEDFIRSFLLQEEKWYDPRKTAIKIYFADDDLPSSPLKLMRKEEVAY